MDSKVSDIIREHIQVPDHIQAIANAVDYDLMQGPSYLVIPGGDVTRIDDDCLATLYDDAFEMAGPDDIIAETYTGAAADTLRDYIDGLPGTLWVDVDCGGIMEREPEGTWTPADELGLEPDEDGEFDGYETDGNGNVWEEPFTDYVYQADSSDIVEALFGRTIAREFV